jgi:hypothetical protein
VSTAAVKTNEKVLKVKVTTHTCAALAGEATE